ncbi:MAG: septum site-determining protein MinD [Candidatus Aenigmarchaeota archaeon ex4484_52]|nr:MAG: septum site-determining protein MinD [Candidatus Aenigmarchaeota archaeon ex4484_52]
MARVISCVSGKGGVGKTTFVANIGIATTQFGHRTIVVDTNLTTPNLGFHLGVPLYPQTLHNLLRGEGNIYDAIYIHPTDLKVIPAGISIYDLKNTDLSKLKEIVNKLRLDHDIIFLDGAAGLGKESIATIEAADEIIVITNAELPSLTDALKTIKIAEELKKPVIGAVVNRIRGLKSEIAKEDIESILGTPVIGSIKEHNKMSDCIATKTPIISYDKHNDYSIEIKKLAAELTDTCWKDPRNDFMFLLKRMLKL